MNIHYLLAVDCILRRYTISIYLTYLLANKILYCVYEYLLTLPPYFSIPYSIFSYRKEGKEKEKRVKRDVVDFAL